jgi:CxxC motif-containing protein (DUF1111 family)
MRRSKKTRFAHNLSPAAQRRLFGSAVLGVAALLTYWYLFSEGLPIFWGPSASAAEIARGRELFEHEWTPNDPLAHGDGLGPVFNAKSCASCHFQGGLGGGGGIEHNAVGFEVNARPGDDQFHTGTIHNFSVDPSQQESFKLVKTLYPMVPGRSFQSGMTGCQTTVNIPDFDPVNTLRVQTTALFGAGWIDLISDRAIIKNARNRGMKEAVRELSLKFDGIPVGRVRHVSGGVGKFGWKGQFARLEDFVAAACANEIGLGTPTTEQAKPLASPARSSEPDLDRKQFRALVSFVKTLPKPVEADRDAAAAHGGELFAAIGCAVCHVPNMGGVKGVYSDFLLYAVEDPPPPGGRGEYSEPPPSLQIASRPDDEPKLSEWKTPALWGVADSAPYMHDGSAPTLHAAILKHRGDANSVTKKFEELAAADQAAVIAFLGTLRAPPDAAPLRDPSITRLARK